MNRIKREIAHKNLLIAAAALLLLVVGSGTAYAKDVGGIQETVKLWVHGNETDVSYEFNEDEGTYLKKYVDENGEEVQEDASAWHGDNSPLTVEELIESEHDSVSVEKTDDGKCMLYFQNKTVDITDKFTDGMCYIHVVGEEGEKYVEVELDENGNLRGHTDSPYPFVHVVDKKGVHRYEDVELDENGNLSEATKKSYKKFFHKFIEVGE